MLNQPLRAPSLCFSCINAGSFRSLCFQIQLNGDDNVIQCFSRIVLAILFLYFTHRSAEWEAVMWSRPTRMGLMSKSSMVSACSLWNCCQSEKSRNAQRHLLSVGGANLERLDSYSVVFRTFTFTFFSNHTLLILNLGLAANCFSSTSADAATNSLS